MSDDGFEYRVVFTRLDVLREDSVGCRSLTEAQRRVNDHRRHLPESDMRVQRRPVGEWEDFPASPVLPTAPEEETEETP